MNMLQNVTDWFKSNILGDQSLQQVRKKLKSQKDFEKRINEAAHHVCQEFGAELFKDGVKWAINEFLKDLWHSASEEPKKVKNLLLETTYEYGNPIYHIIKYMPNGNNACAWREWYKGSHVSRWLYIEDLLPKQKGGNQ